MLQQITKNINTTVRNTILKNNQHYLSHSSIDVYFKQSKEDFVVTEIPLYEFTGDGEHLIIKFRKSFGR